MKPSSLDDIAPVTGYTALRKLIAWYHGRNLFVPQTAREDHPLVVIMGFPAFRALVREFPGEHIWIGTIEEDQRYLRNRRMAEDFAAGVSLADVAAKYALGIRRVQQIRMELADDGFLRYAEGYRPGCRRLESVI